MKPADTQRTATVELPWRKTAVGEGWGGGGGGEGGGVGDGG